MPAFDKRIGDFQAVNTQVLGISTDSPFSHENWAKSVGISNYPLLSDVQRSVAREYGVYWPDWNANVRATFVIDTQGKVRFVERYGKGELPLITTCCPSWVDFMEKFHSDMIGHFSSCKSPHEIVGALSKTYYAGKAGVDPTATCGDLTSSYTAFCSMYGVNTTKPLIVIRFDMYLMLPPQLTFEAWVPCARLGNFW